LLSLDHAGRLPQVVHDEVGADVAAGSHLGAIPGPDQEGRAARPSSHLQVGCLVADHEGVARIKASLPGSPLEEGGAGLAAAAAVRRDMGADVDGAQVDAGLGETLAEAAVDRIQRALGEVSAPHPGLVGDDQQLHAQLAQMAESLSGAVDELDLRRI
jgi:hypothetical protein